MSLVCAAVSIVQVETFSPAKLLACSAVPSPSMVAAVVDVYTRVVRWPSKCLGPSKQGGEVVVRPYISNQLSSSSTSALLPAPRPMGKRCRRRRWEPLGGVRLLLRRGQSFQPPIHSSSPGLRFVAIAFNFRKRSRDSLSSIVSALWSLSCLCIRSAVNLLKRLSVD